VNFTCYPEEVARKPKAEYLTPCLGRQKSLYIVWKVSAVIPDISKAGSSFMKPRCRNTRFSVRKVAALELSSYY
jgi:hypothetical protein